MVLIANVSLQMFKDVTSIAFLNFTGILKGHKIKVAIVYHIMLNLRVNATGLIL